MENNGKGVKRDVLNLGIRKKKNREIYRWFCLFFFPQAQVQFYLHSLQSTWFGDRWQVSGERRVMATGDRDGVQEKKRWPGGWAALPVSSTGSRMSLHRRRDAISFRIWTWTQQVGWVQPVSSRPGPCLQRWPSPLVHLSSWPCQWAVPVLWPGCCAALSAAALEHTLGPFHTPWVGSPHGQIEDWIPLLPSAPFGQQLLQQSKAFADVIVVLASHQAPGMFKLRALGHRACCLLRLKFPFKFQQVLHRQQLVQHGLHGRRPRSSHNSDATAPLSPWPTRWFCFGN